MSASRTRLATGKPAISNSNFPAAHIGLVLQLPPTLKKAHVRHRARQMPVLHHAFDIEVFNANGVKATGHVRGELVQGIIADTRGSGM